MLNKELNLNQNLFTENPDMSATRNGFGSGLKKAGELDEKVVALCCDLTGSTKMNFFADAFPERFVQIGVAEQNLASVGSGMAAMGKIPFISSYAMFNPGRNWEQIRTTICYNDSNVKIIGSHAGISVGPDGGTHQAIEDIAITRVIPRMEVIYPCDSVQAEKATLAMAKTTSPTYLRLARENTPVMTTEETPFEIGKAQTFYNPESELKLGIVSAGPVLANVLKAAKHFDENGIGVKVINMHTIKPMDNSALTELAGEVDKIMTVEEHQAAGGLGSAVSEFISQNNPTHMKIVGINDRFGESGSTDELLHKYKLDAEGIIEHIELLLK